MIEPEKLDAVRLIVCHKNPESPCPDGVASALLLRDALPGAMVRFVSHGVELLELSPTPGTLFCDIAPPEERAAAWAATEHVYVLDHHRTSEKVVRAFEANRAGVFADEKLEPGVSGAVLAYREVWLPRRYPEGTAPGRRHAPIERFALLAGIRDTWQRESPVWLDACAQAEALSFWPWHAWPLGCFSFGMSREMGDMLNLGYTLLEKKEKRTEAILASGSVHVTRAGTRFLIVPTRETSDVAELAGSAVDLVIGFGFSRRTNGPGEISLSTRSRGAFDCAAFCRSLGGGGHTRAAGVALELEPEDLQPYQLIENLLEAWERSAATSSAG